MKNQNYEALRHLSRNEYQVQKAWEEWNELKWETEFDYDDIKEGDCVIFNDFTILFCENGWGKTYAKQNGGFVLYENQANDLIRVQEFIDEKMDELRDLGYASADC
jgi:hypothetical protein